MNVEHCVFLSWFSQGVRESHKQDGETLSARRGSRQARQRLAILPWPSNMAFEPSLKL
jgi:hypothetical protein